MAVIKLVQGDTKPTLLVDVKDANTGLPIDISTSTTRLKIRMSTATSIKETLTGTLLPGLTATDGSVSTTAPYDVAGFGGRVGFSWSSTSLDTAGDMLGEVEVTFSDNSIQSVYEVLKFKVREQFVP
jgi:hypothetical protein